MNANAVGSGNARLYATVVAVQMVRNVLVLACAGFTVEGLANRLYQEYQLFAVKTAMTLSVLAKIPALLDIALSFKQKRPSSVNN